MPHTQDCHTCCIPTFTSHVSTLCPVRRPSSPWLGERSRQMLFLQAWGRGVSRWQGLGRGKAGRQGMGPAQPSPSPRYLWRVMEEQLGSQLVQVTFGLEGRWFIGSWDGAEGVRFLCHSSQTPSRARLEDGVPAMPSSLWGAGPWSWHLVRPSPQCWHSGTETGLGQRATYPGHTVSAGRLLAQPHGRWLQPPAHPPGTWGCPIVCPGYLQVWS